MISDWTGVKILLFFKKLSLAFYVVKMYTDLLRRYVECAFITEKKRVVGSGNRKKYTVCQYGDKGDEFHLYWHEVATKVNENGILT